MSSRPYLQPVLATRVRDEDIPHFIIPYHLYPIEMSLVIKTRETAAALGPAINSAVSASHTGRAAFEIRPIGDYVTDSTGDTRFTMFVLAIFAGASAMTGAIRQLLYDVRPFDGVTLAGVIALVVFVSVAAAGVPA